MGGTISPTSGSCVQIITGPLVSSMLGTMSDVKFHLQRTRYRRTPRHLHDELPFVRRFRFIPISNPCEKGLSRLRIMFFPRTGKRARVVVRMSHGTEKLKKFLTRTLRVSRAFIHFAIAGTSVPCVRRGLRSIVTGCTWGLY